MAPGVTARPSAPSISFLAMAATIIDGKAIAADVRAEVKAEVETLTAAGRPAPGLATILVGDDPASAIYVANKRKASAEVGIVDFHQHLSDQSTEEEVAQAIDACNADPAVSGILLQLPVPPQLDGSVLTARIAPEKDVDGLTPISAGRLMQGSHGLRPCTPVGVIELLDRHEVEFRGDEAVVVVRSRAGLLTPVPGGVGPMTIAMLLRNTLTAAITQSG